MFCQIKWTKGLSLWRNGVTSPLICPLAFLGEEHPPEKGPTKRSLVLGETICQRLSIRFLGRKWTNPFEGKHQNAIPPQDYSFSLTPFGRESKWKKIGGKYFLLQLSKMGHFGKSQKPQNIPPGGPPNPPNKPPVCHPCIPGPCRVQKPTPGVHHKGHLNFTHHVDKASDSSTFGSSSREIKVWWKRRKSYYFFCEKGHY